MKERLPGGREKVECFVRRVVGFEVELLKGLFFSSSLLEEPFCGATGLPSFHPSSLGTSTYGVHMVGEWG